MISVDIIQKELGNFFTDDSLFIRYKMCHLGQSTTTKMVSKEFDGGKFVIKSMEMDDHNFFGTNSS